MLVKKSKNATPLTNVSKANEVSKLATLAQANRLQKDKGYFKIIIEFARVFSADLLLEQEYKKKKNKV